MDHLAFLKCNLDELSVNAALERHAVKGRDGSEAIDVLWDRILFGFGDRNHWRSRFGTVGSSRSNPTLEDRFPSIACRVAQSGKSGKQDERNEAVPPGFRSP